jgi:two-component system heavy metal sensor histidine kinase CusS
MSAKPWRLGRRITLSFALAALVLSLALATFSGRILWISVHAEIEALAREELEETQALLRGRTFTPAEFHTLVSEMASDHEGVQLAWRLVDRSGRILEEYGEPDLLAHLPRSWEDGEQTRSLGPGMRWLHGSLTEDLEVAVLVRGLVPMERFRKFAQAAAGIIVFSTGLAGLAGNLLGRRVGGLLERVARSAQVEDDRRVADPWEGTRAPEEIRTVLEALRENLRRTREEAEHTQLMTSGLAHELRSPLQNLMGESQVTLLRDRTPEEYKRVLESQLEELGELSRAVDNLVNLCADGEAHKRMTRERFDLAEELRLRLAREFQLARRRDVDMELVAEGPLMLDGDRESLLLALRNIVTNAIEWAPPGGNVVVQAQRTEDGTELLVDDDGPGVPPERRERLFEPFQRGGLARGRRVGFGIGLALTRVAVETHGGTIEIGDSPMGGARFRILLPA